VWERASPLQLETDHERAGEHGVLAKAHSTVNFGIRCLLSCKASQVLLSGKTIDFKLAVASDLILNLRDSLQVPWSIAHRLCFTRSDDPIFLRQNFPSKILCAGNFCKSHRGRRWTNRGAQQPSSTAISEIVTLKALCRP
jgi:hypothetical protein